MPIGVHASPENSAIAAMTARSLRAVEEPPTAKVGELLQAGSRIIFVVRRRALACEVQVADGDKYERQAGDPEQQRHRPEDDAEDGAGRPVGGVAGERATPRIPNTSPRTPQTTLNAASAMPAAAGSCRNGNSIVSARAGAPTLSDAVGHPVRGCRRLCADCGCRPGVPPAGFGSGIV